MLDQRAMDLAVKTKLVSRLDYFLRDFRIPLGDFTDEIKTDFRIAKFFENGIDGLKRESTIQIAPLDGIFQFIIPAGKCEPRLIIYSEKDARGWKHKDDVCYRFGMGLSSAFYDEHQDWSGIR